MRQAWLRGAVGLACLILAGGFSVALSGCRAQPTQRETVRIGAGTFPASAVIFIAQDRGFFKAEGLEAEVTTYVAGAQALDDAIAGTLDFAAVAETPVTRAALDGKSFTVIATVAEIDRANYIIARRDAGIRSAEDLAGKRLGFVPNTSGDYFQEIYLTSSLVDAGDVVKVELKAGELVDALVRGRVDAVSAWPPLTSQLERALAGNAVILDEPGLYVMSWNVVRSETPRPSTKTQEALLRAIVRAERFAQEHPDAAQKITERWTGTDLQTLKSLWPDARWRLGLDQTLVMSLEDEGSWMRQRTPQTQAMPDFLAFIDPNPLEAVAPGSIDLIKPGD